MDVILIRHGKTDGNIHRRYVGCTDEPLCEEGLIHARDTGVDPGVAAVYVSPLKRTLQTAQIKFPNARLIVCADLREMDFGDFEGRTSDELMQDADYIRWVGSNCTLRCPNGEQVDDFADRTCRAFDSIVTECLNNNEPRLVVVAHGGSIMAILGKYGKPERAFYDWYVGNCCGYRVQLTDTTWATASALENCEAFETLPSDPDSSVIIF